MNIRLFLLTLIAALSVVQVARAQETPVLPAPLEEQRQRGAQVYYLGKHDVLDGWVMVRGGKPEVYYVTPGGNAIVMGVLFNAQGDMMTPNQVASLKAENKQAIMGMTQPDAAKTAIPAPAPVADAAPAAPAAPAIDMSSPSEQLVAAMKNAPGITWGNADLPTFYAFLDPSCKHCQQFLREVEPFVVAGKVAVHMTLVGFTDTSLKQAAFVLVAADGADRMVRYAKGDETAIPASDTDTSGIKNNVQLMDKSGLSGTPMILYRAANDQKIRLIKGRPLNVPAVVNDLAPGAITP